MGVSAEMGENRLRSAKGWFGVEDPFGSTERRGPGGQGIHLCQPFKVAIESQLWGAM